MNTICEHCHNETKLKESKPVFYEGFKLANSICEVCFLECKNDSENIKESIDRFFEKWQKESGKMKTCKHPGSVYCDECDPDSIYKREITTNKRDATLTASDYDLLEAVKDAKRQIEMMIERMPLDKIATSDSEMISLLVNVIEKAEGRS